MWRSERIAATFLLRGHEDTFAMKVRAIASQSFSSEKTVTSFCISFSVIFYKSREAFSLWIPYLLVWGKLKGV